MIDRWHHLLLEARTHATARAPPAPRAMRALYPLDLAAPPPTCSRYPVYGYG